MDTMCWCLGVYLEIMRISAIFSRRMDSQRVIHGYEGMVQLPLSLARLNHSWTTSSYEGHMQMLYLGRHPSSATSRWTRTEMEQGTFQYMQASVSSGVHDSMLSAHTLELIKYKWPMMPFMTRWAGWTSSARMFNMPWQCAQTPLCQMLVTSFVQPQSNIFLHKIAHRKEVLGKKILCSGEQTRCGNIFDKCEQVIKHEQEIFQAWRHWSRFSQLQREHVRHGRELRKAKQIQVMQDARSAADRRDMWGRYKIVRQLAPKHPRRKMQIRQDGCILTPDQELPAIVKHYQNLLSPASPTPRPRYIDKEMDVTVDEICAYLKGRPLRKAGMRTAAAGCAFRVCAEVIAPTIHKQLTDMWRPGRISLSKEWTQAELILLTKPGASGYSVKDWRPIGLQHPVSKATTHLLLDRVTDDVQRWTMQYPLFGYVKGRDTCSALRRVLRHCIQVRQTCQLNTKNLHARFQGGRIAPLQGCLMVCLDLSSAFDRVPWTHIDEALQCAQVPRDVAQILLAQLENSSYLITHGGKQAEVYATRGVKQGCCASPILFLAFSALVCQRVDAVLGTGWCAEHLNIYADDTHGSWTFDSMGQLARAVKELAVIMRTLEDMGMTLNNDKAKAMLALSGTMRDHARQRHTHGQKKARKLIIPDGLGRRFVPLVQCAPTMGVKHRRPCYECKRRDFDTGKFQGSFAPNVGSAKHNGLRCGVWFSNLVCCMHLTACHSLGISSSRCRR